MRLLLITNVFPNPLQPTRGLFNRELVAALAREHEVRVVAPISWVDEWRARGGNPLGPDRRALVAGAEVEYPRYYYPPRMLRRWYGSFFWWSVRGRVRRLLQAFQPEVVLGYWAHPDGEAAVRAARRRGVAAVVMVGGSDVLVLTRDPARQRRVVDVLRSADAVVAVSHDLKAELVRMGVRPETIHVVYRGVDLDRFSPGDRAEARRRLGMPAEGRILVWVGRLVPVKGLDVLLEACVDVRKRGPALSVHLVGDGPLRKSLGAEVRRRGLEDMVFFVGSVSPEHLADWYRAADLTVLPSRSEGVPNVLREAQACGTPFLASNVGGVREIAREPWDHLVPPEDPAALAEAIIKMLARGAVPRIAPPRPAGWLESAHALVEVLQAVIRSRRVGSR